MTPDTSLAVGADTVRALEWTGTELRVLDQTKLPGRVEYVSCVRCQDGVEAIRSMQVRGAPAIGIAAAYSVVLAASERFRENPTDWKDRILVDFQVLAEARPTAVNLFWALDRMRAEVAKVEGDPLAPLAEAAVAIHHRDIAANRSMGELGADLLLGASGVLTHCNTGSLATGGYGTALGVIRSAFRRGLGRIYATETRPWLQGARLTLWELSQDAIPSTLIADSAAAWLMRTGKVEWVVVGADRIAANGDTANKIGTYQLAVAARHHGVRFMVVAPTSTIDLATISGDGIEIEERGSGELLDEYFRERSPIVKAWNPVFDVTPAELIDAIVTERGVVQRPDAHSLARLFRSD